MLPQYIKVKNFKSYVDEYIDFTLFNSLFCVVGDNGAGKSSIIDMITTALFNCNGATDNRGSGMDNLINHNAESFEIEFAFIMNNIEYKIIRRKSKTNHELEFYINNINQSEKINETQQKINNVIKMDYQTFLDTVCIGQGQSNHFMEKNPNERKEVFVQILGLDEFEILEKYTKDLKKNTKEEIDKIENKTNLLQRKISLKDDYKKQIKDGEKQISDLKLQIQDLEIELETVVSEKAQYEQIKKQRDQILNQRIMLEKKILSIKNSLKNDNITKNDLFETKKQKQDIINMIDSLQKINDNSLIEQNELSNQISSLETTNNILTAQAKELKVKYDNLKNYNDATCNFCGSLIDNNHKQQHLTELMEEGKKYISEININKNVINDLKSKLNMKKSTFGLNIGKLSVARNQNHKIIQAETQYDSLIKKIEESNTSLIEYENDYKNNLEIKVDNLIERTFNDNELKYSLNTLRQQLTSLESKVAIAKKELKEVKDAEIEFKDLKEKLTELNYSYEDYESLAIAYGKSGIQADIIANTLPEIEEEINNILSLLTKDITIEFKTQKDTKNKKSKAKNIASIETLDIIVKDSEGSRKYETYSGGEKFRVDFSCHVGLAKFLAKRAGAIIDFFIVDEGLGSQDSNAIQNFIHSVHQLTQTFKQVMIISHIPEAQNGFDNKILIEKNTLDGSKVTIIGK